jgi:hypothetical protein
MSNALWRYGWKINGSYEDLTVHYHWYHSSSYLTSCETCDKVCQWLCPGPLVSFNNKTDHQDITEHISHSVVWYWSAFLWTYSEIVIQLPYDHGHDDPCEKCEKKKNCLLCSVCMLPIF